MKTMALLMAAAMGCPALAAEQKSKAPATPAGHGSEMIAGMDITIGADGSIANVLPAATLPEPIRQLLLKRVPQWRYEVPMWEGKPASVAHHLILRLVAMPTTSGGFVLRILGQGSEWHAGSEYSPKAPNYPEAAMRQEIGGTFSYALRLGQDGRIDRVRRLYPETLSDSIRKSMDEAAQYALRATRYRPVIVNGVAVVCETNLPYVFTPAGKRDVPKEKIPEFARAGLETPCPKLTLSTNIENMIL